MNSSRAFTILELILTVAMIGILITLLMGMFGGVVDARRGAGSMSLARQHAAILTMYAIDYDDFIPYFADPQATFTVMYIGQNGYRIRYFDSSYWWTIALNYRYYEGGYYDRSFLSPYAEFDRQTSFRYTACALADPTFWNLNTRTGPEQWRATRLGETTHSSAKALIIDMDSFFSQVGDNQALRKGTIACYDGHASRHTQKQLNSAMPGGEGNWTGSAHGFGIRGMHTIDGVRGRDIP